MNRKVLLLGAGSSRTLRADSIWRTPNASLIPIITAVDIEPTHKPDAVWDLNVLPWPWPDGTFDEVHAYELLEHLGQQGDAKTFFAHFYEIWRLLKPGGYVGASVPRWDSIWAWGDPSHRRIISEGSLTYLDRTKYAEQIGKTAMTDFRSIWHGDFEALGLEKTSEQLYFLLRAHKPARV